MNRWSGEPCGERGQGIANLVEAGAEVFAAMAGDEHERPLAVVWSDALAQPRGQLLLHVGLTLPLRAP